ncbi:MAG: DmsE family decaheme c-type cytochrome [Bryobacteraceae bacterium]
MAGLILAAGLNGSPLGADAPKQPPLPPGYAGSAACKTCHPDVWFNFYKNPHFKTLALSKAPPESTGCESCHGPGLAHIAGHGDKSKITAFSVLPPGGVLDRCLTCHGETLARANIRRSVHTANGIVCTNCHSIHKAATPRNLLAGSQADLCYTCHADVRGQFEMPSHHRVNEGVVQCSDCHNPHGAVNPTWRMASRPRMVKQALANEEACMNCHPETRGPFTFEHPPVRVEGCETCHFPHGSTNSRLLRRPVVFTLCLECHNGAPGFARTGKGVPQTPITHNLANARFQNCTSCHISIHGSNADAFFLR